jgi:hypothetical protein
MTADERARAFWVTGASTGEIREDALPPSGADDVVVETLFSGISRGTETLVFRGGVPESQYAAMRCPFQAGEFPWPVKYGYAAVGRVADGPAALRGRCVFALHPHQTRFIVPASAAIPLPDGVPPGRAVLAANMETALNGIWDAGIGPADRVCVLGAGVVGLLSAWLAADMPGVGVTLVDPDAGKAAAAKALGLTLRTDADGLADFDVVVHASGNPDGLRTGIAVAGFEATVLEMSWFGDREVRLPLGETFHSRRLTLRSSQVGAVSPGRRARWTHRRRLQAALALLADDRLDALISGESAFESLPDTMQDLATGALPALCHRIRY